MLRRSISFETTSQVFRMFCDPVLLPDVGSQCFIVSLDMKPPYSNFRALVARIFFVQFPSPAAGIPCRNAKCPDMHSCSA